MRLPSFFDSGMVLAKTARVWGWTAPGKTVTATFREEKFETVANDTGRFEFTIVSKSFGGPYTLVVADKVFHNVFVGRVWLCGGQSNMETPVSRVKYTARVTDEPLIRVFQAEKGLDFDAPKTDVNGNWYVAKGDFLDYVYAVPYFFAKKLLRYFNDGVPIGLVCFPAGGTPLEGWLPEETLHEQFPVYFKDLERVKMYGSVQKSTEDAETAKNIWLSELNERDTGLNEKWFEHDYDDSDWEKRALLDNTGFPEYGSVWLRKRFHLAVKPAKGAAVLHFGRVEDSVTVYVNGVEVLHVGYMYPPCTCVLPDVLNVGENTIAVRVVGETKKPHLVPGKEYFLQCGDTRLNFNILGEKWKHRTGTKMHACPPGVWFYGYPCGVYNYMLAPLLGLCAEGLIWYQGESNVKKPVEYEPMFIAFVKFIRRSFRSADGKTLPIIFTQLANYIDPMALAEVTYGEPTPGKRWAELREQQRRCLQIPSTAMAVTIDCGEYNDLHPLDKKTVGERLAMHARRLVYGEKIITDGPTVLNAVIKDGKLTINFQNAQSLWTKNGHPLLDIIDKTNNLYRIYATIVNETLVANLGDVIPAKIRFGWTDCPPVTLYNAFGLPASPFEIDM